MLKLINFAAIKLSEFASRLNAQQDLANREKQLNFITSMTYLPDPDPVLRAKGKDISVYRELLIDSHLSGALEKRKISVQAMNWELTENGDQKEIDLLYSYFENLDMFNMIDKILDCIYYGYQPFVINWQLQNGFYLPFIEDRPQEYFFFDGQNQIRIKSNSNPSGIIADETNFIFSRYKPSYLNPYGDRLAAKVFWPVVFKKGGLKFWLTMTEKYGMPFIVGKLPRGQKTEAADKLLSMLENMVQDAVAVINDDEDIEIKESSGKSSSADIYERLTDFCNREISKAILSVADTMELGKVGSYAATQTQRESEEDKTLGDKLIVENFFNKVIALIHRINFGNNEAPKIMLYRKEDVDDVIAKRDETLTKGVGVRFTKKYIKETYNLNDDDFEIAEPDNSNQSPSNFADSNISKARTAIENMNDKIPDILLQLQIEQTLKPVFDLIKNGSDYSDVMNKLVELYPDMKTSQLESLLQKVMFVSEVWGRINGAKDE